MTQELTPEQRLTQIEKILQSAIKLSYSNTSKIDANTEAIEALTNRVDRLTEQMGRATEMFIDSMGVMRIMQNNFETMQSEIRGLQVENRRILDRLFGEENQE
jgi:ribonuclease HII